MDCTDSRNCRLVSLPLTAKMRSINLSIFHHKSNIGYGEEKRRNKVASKKEVHRKGLCYVASLSSKQALDEFFGFTRFLVSTVTKKIKSVDDVAQQDEAIKSFLWEARLWQEDPALRAIRGIQEVGTTAKEERRNNQLQIVQLPDVPQLPQLPDVPSISTTTNNIREYTRPIEQMLHGFIPTSAGGIVHHPSTTYNNGAHHVQLHQPRYPYYMDLGRGSRGRRRKDHSDQFVSPGCSGRHGNGELVVLMEVTLKREEIERQKISQQLFKISLSITPTIYQEIKERAEDADFIYTTTESCQHISGACWLFSMVVPDIKFILFN
ncbi:hypothetical protein HAX54_012426 [Datura stramonium]|uniref:LOB domain-containing protein n=1 Tax=Datura stramonium TaxID=4076 RepID=A0ABS8TJR4_DATST|nr:hypothetical protein [Datura stramonium]